MSPELLERATPGFRRGYLDAREGRPIPAEYQPGTFFAYDYDEGRDAYGAEIMADERRRAAFARAQAGGDL